jgi:hypothetical protein
MSEFSDKGVTIGSLKARTQNLGDYIQILACLGLLERMQLRPTAYFDRDSELASAPGAEACSGGVVLPLNGWFKGMVGTDPQWPPHQKIIPVFVSFHVRPHQCPALLEPRSIDYMKAHGPVGCRDPFTQHILGELGVSTYLSHCLSLTFPARSPDERGDSLIVASRDREIVDVIPPQYRQEHVYVNHYQVRDRFEAYLAEAGELLAFYRKRARLVITTFLHCALPCIAMGIPVVVFLPRQRDEFQKTSDEQRFSGLMQIAPVYRFEDAATVDLKASKQRFRQISKSALRPRWPSRVSARRPSRSARARPCLCLSAESTDEYELQPKCVLASALHKNP